MKKKVLISIVMGSQSDWKTLTNCEEILKIFSINYEKKIVSAHRTPERLYEYAKNVESRGIEVVIAGAGGAAHLPGMIASLTTIPVLGVPIESKVMKGIDSIINSTDAGRHPITYSSNRKSRCNKRFPCSDFNIRK